MNNNRRAQPPGGDCHDVFGSESPVTVPHHRITRPPGGESSDIFGSSPTTTPPSTPRKVKNYMASTIFTPSQGSQVKSRNRPDDDSFNRLFGAKTGDMADGLMTPRGKNHQKSNIFSGVEKTNGVVVENGVKNGVNGHANGIVNGTNGVNGHANGTNGHTNGTNGTIAAAVAATNGLVVVTTTTNGTNGVATNGVNGHVTNGNGHTHGNGMNGHATNGTNGHAFETGSISGSSSGSATPNGSINGDYKTNGHNGSNGMPGTPSKRIPPGGYSSKLW